MGARSSGRAASPLPLGVGRLLLLCSYRLFVFSAQVYDVANRVFLFRSGKKALNVESPSFTPSTLQSNKKSTFSTQAASAAPFTPRGPGGNTAPQASQQSIDAAVFNPSNIREFQPQNYDLGSTVCLLSRP